MATVYSAAEHEAINLNELEGTVLVVTVPAAFSPTCTDQCVPGVMENLDDLRDAGIQQIVVISGDPGFAVEAWADENGWDEEDVLFASDYGEFELRDEVGKLGDENPGVPTPIGHLLRRSYTVLRDGQEVWQFTESDSSKYTLDIDNLKEAL